MARILKASAQNPMYRFTANEFADLSTSEFVSVDFERQPNKVWSGLKHLGTHDLSEFVPFAVSLLSLDGWNHHVSARGFVVARFVARSALVCWFELLL